MWGIFSEVVYRSHKLPEEKEKRFRLELEFPEDDHSADNIKNIGIR